MRKENTDKLNICFGEVHVLATEGTSAFQMFPTVVNSALSYLNFKSFADVAFDD